MLADNSTQPEFHHTGAFLVTVRVERQWYSGLRHCVSPTSENRITSQLEQQFERPLPLFSHRAHSVILGSAVADID